jgi:hypothetical protein
MAKKWRRREDIEPVELKPVDIKRPRSNIWTALLVIALLAYLLGIFLLWKELTELYM